MSKRPTYEELEQKVMELELEVVRSREADRVLQSCNEIFEKTFICRKTNRELERRVEERTAELVKLDEKLKRKKAECRQSEELLFESQAWFHAVIESAEDSIFIKDHHLRYTLVNPAMEHLLDSRRLSFWENPMKNFLEMKQEHIREVDSCVLRGEIIGEEEHKPVSGVLKTFHVV